MKSELSKPAGVQYESLVCLFIRKKGCKGIGKVGVYLGNSFEKKTPLVIYRAISRV